MRTLCVDLKKLSFENTEKLTHEYYFKAIFFIIAKHLSITLLNPAQHPSFTSKENPFITSLNLPDKSEFVQSGIAYTSNGSDLGFFSCFANILDREVHFTFCLHEGIKEDKVLDCLAGIFRPQYLVVLSDGTCMRKKIHVLSWKQLSFVEKVKSFL